MRGIQVANVAAQFCYPQIPLRLQNNIEQLFCTQITPAEALVIEDVYSCFLKHIDQNPIPVGAFVTLAFVPAGEFSLLIDPNILGLAVKFVYVNMDLVRRTKLLRGGSLDVLYPTILEELFHSLYNQRDEDEVKKMVYQVIQTTNLEVSLDMLYDSRYGIDGKLHLELACKIS